MCAAPGSALSPQAHPVVKYTHFLIVLVLLVGCDSAPVAPAIDPDDVEIVAVQEATPEHPDYPAYRATAQYNGAVELTAAQITFVFQGAQGSQLDSGILVKSGGVSEGERFSDVLPLVPNTTYDEIACWTYHVKVVKGATVEQKTYDGTC